VFLDLRLYRGYCQPVFRSVAFMILSAARQSSAKRVRRPSKDHHDMTVDVNPLRRYYLGLETWAKANEVSVAGSYSTTAMDQPGIRAANLMVLVTPGAVRLLLAPQQEYH